MVTREDPGSASAERRLKELGIQLPAPPEPFGTYDVRDQPKVADAALELLQDVFDKDKRPCRVVYGVAGLPLGAPVELEIIFEAVG